MSERIPLPFPFGWFCVADSVELAPGELLKLRRFGQELLLFRGEDEEAHLLDAYCAHLGAHLGVGGEVVGNTVRCPFHAWRYDGSGQCVEIPYAKRIPRAAKIRSWRVCERNGLIFAWHHPDDAEPDWEIPEVPEWGAPGWTAPEQRDFQVRSHAQEMAENVVDPIHFQYVHGVPRTPDMQAEIDGHCFHAYQGLTFTTPRGEIQGRVDVRNYGPGFGVTRFQGVVETLLLITGIPIDDELHQTRIRFQVKEIEGNPEGTRGVARAFIAELERQYGQDIPIWENKIHLAQPVLCDGDGPIPLLRQFYRQFYPPRPDA